MRGKHYLENIYIKIYGLKKYLIKKGVVIGDDAHIYSNIATTESYLIKIGNNVTISNGVSFITHDNSISKVLLNVSDLFGRIEIGDNCFIGAHSIIMPGVTLANNTIVAAGSVVTKSVMEDGCIIGGNPAVKIGTIKALGLKYKEYAINISGLKEDEKRYKILHAKMLSRKNLE